ncbi:MAG: hypothetical protein AB1757_01080 [Acidobacteriota bacterium]
MTHRYYKYYNDSDLFSGMRYVEALNVVAIREIIVNDDAIIASNIKYPKWGVMLAEGDCAYDSIEEVQKIDLSEFTHYWERHLKNNAGRWHLTKLAYSPGDQVRGYIEVFLPQGAIIDLGNSILGVADYHACKASTRESFVMGKGHFVTARVQGYDEQYQWLILDLPQVSSERRIYEF